jgi:hypothetical protein
MDKPIIARRELEISTGWAKQYPEYFLKAIKKFRDETAHMPKFKIDASRKGFVTYIASL